MKNLKLEKWLSLVTGILLVICGVIYVRNPVEGALALVNILAVLMIIIGVLQIVSYVKSTVFKSGIFVVEGIINILFGILIMRNISVSAIVLSYIVAFWVLLNGIMGIAGSIDLKKIGLKEWWLYLVSGIIGVIFGIMLLGNFGLSMVYVSMVCSIYMFVLGIVFISAFFSIGKFEKILKSRNPEEL